MRAIVVIFIVMLVAESSHSETVDLFCQQISSVGSDPKPRNNPGFWAKLGFFLDPGSAISVAQLSGREFEILPEPNPQTNIRVGEPFYVFAPEQGRKLSQDDKANITRLRNHVDSFQRTYLANFRTTINLDECLRRANRIGLSDSLLQSYRQALMDISKLQTRYLESEGTALVRQASRIDRKVRIIESSNYRSALSYIESLDRDANRKKLNLVFIFHGGEDGTLLDFQGQIVPPLFFRKLALLKNLNSVTIYACNPRQIASLYFGAISDLQTRGHPIYFAVSGGVLSELSVVSLGFFSHFLEKLLKGMSPHFEY